VTTANRGKSAEKAIATYLSELSQKVAAFDWHRQYDARSAGGRFPAQPGDFAFYSAASVGFFKIPSHGLIEVKEVEHDYRLPKKNFEKEQIAKLRKRELAGGKIAVVVNFTTTKKWVLVPLKFFRENLDLPSWDLRGFKQYDKAREALDTFFSQEI